MTAPPPQNGQGFNLSMSPPPQYGMNASMISPSSVVCWSWLPLLMILRTRRSFLNTSESS
jgi:hypothetical protein